MADQCWSSVTWATNVDHTESSLCDQAIQMGVNKVLARSGSKVAEEAFLYVF